MFYEKKNSQHSTQLSLRARSFNRFIIQVHIINIRFLRYHVNNFIENMGYYLPAAYY